MELPYEDVLGFVQHLVLQFPFRRQACQAPTAMAVLRDLLVVATPAGGMDRSLNRPATAWVVTKSAFVCDDDGFVGTALGGARCTSDAIGADPPRCAITAWLPALRCSQRSVLGVGTGPANAVGSADGGDMRPWWDA